jgi:hypothetical protein
MGGWHSSTHNSGQKVISDFSTLINASANLLHRPLCNSSQIAAWPAPSASPGSLLAKQIPGCPTAESDPRGAKVSLFPQPSLDANAAQTLEDELSTYLTWDVGRTSEATS